MHVAILKVQQSFVAAMTQLVLDVECANSSLKTPPKPFWTRLPPLTLPEDSSEETETKMWSPFRLHGDSPPGTCSPAHPLRKQSFNPSPGSDMTRGALAMDPQMRALQHQPESGSSSYKSAYPLHQGHQDQQGHQWKVSGAQPMEDCPLVGKQESDESSTLPTKRLRTPSDRSEHQTVDPTKRLRTPSDRSEHQSVDPAKQLRTPSDRSEHQTVEAAKRHCAPSDRCEHQTVNPSSLGLKSHLQSPAVPDVTMTRMTTTTAVTTVGLPSQTVMEVSCQNVAIETTGECSPEVQSENVATKATLETVSENVASRPAQQQSPPRNMEAETTQEYSSENVELEQQGDNNDMGHGDKKGTASKEPSKARLTELVGAANIPEHLKQLPSPVLEKIISLTLDINSRLKISYFNDVQALKLLHFSKAKGTAACINLLDMLGNEYQAE
eukprot:gene12678-15908_t